jgi:hypothetical protein
LASAATRRRRRVTSTRVGYRVPMTVQTNQESLAKGLVDLSARVPIALSGERSGGEEVF